MATQFRRLSRKRVRNMYWFLLIESINVCVTFWTIANRVDLMRVERRRRCHWHPSITIHNFVWRLLSSRTYLRFVRVDLVVETAQLRRWCIRWHVSMAGASSILRLLKSVCIDDDTLLRKTKRRWEIFRRWKSRYCRWWFCAEIAATKANPISMSIQWCASSFQHVVNGRDSVTYWANFTRGHCMESCEWIDCKKNEIEISFASKSLRAVSAILHDFCISLHSDRKQPANVLRECSCRTAWIAMQNILSRFFISRDISIYHSQRNTENASQFCWPTAELFTTNSHIHFHCRSIFRLPSTWKNFLKTKEKMKWSFAKLNPFTSKPAATAKFTEYNSSDLSLFQLRDKWRKIDNVTLHCERHKDTGTSNWFFFVELAIPVLGAHKSSACANCGLNDFASGHKSNKLLAINFSPRIQNTQIVLRSWTRHHYYS